MTKKEYILQYVTIGVSLLAVFASIFAGWMAYNASIISTEVSGKISKENEVESRLYQQRYDLYKKFLVSLNQVINSEDETKGNTKTYSSLETKPFAFRKILLDYGPEIRTLGSDNLVKAYSCVFKKVNDVIEDQIYGTECTEEMSQMECSNPKWWLYANNILGGMHYLENTIRIDLGGNSLPDLHIPDHGGWTTSISCSGDYSNEHYGIYGENEDDFYYEVYSPAKGNQKN